MPLVRKGDDVPVEHVVEQEVSPVRDGQGSVNFVLYRIDRRLPELTATQPRTYVITEDVARSVPPSVLALHVPRSAAEATLSVLTGQGSAVSTRASCALYFGRTEITANAASKTTGDRKKVLVKWEGGA